jgi:hypothetical protein
VNLVGQLVVFILQTIQALQNLLQCALLQIRFFLRPQPGGSE